MRGVSILLLLVTLPLLGAIGHDIYLFYENQAQGAPPPPGGWMGYLSALGFLWTRYSPESYTWVVENNEAGVWAIINEILTYKAVFVAAAFAGIFYVVVLVVKILTLLTSRNEGMSGKGGPLSSMARDQKSKFQYKKR